MKIVILAAGLGSRFLDKEVPKPLTQLNDGETILHRQIALLTQFVPLSHIHIVVGYREERIMEAFPGAVFVHNPHYAEENTAKSLWRAFREIDEDVVWLNGDVVFHPTVIERVLVFGKNCLVVNRAEVGEEEVKYRTDDERCIIEVSKTVAEPEGEALGVNGVMKEDLPLLTQCLEKCTAGDYFERGIELAIDQGMEMLPLCIDQNLCTEVDFPEDLERAQALLRLWDPSSG